MVVIRATIPGDEGEKEVTAPLTGYADRVSVRAGETISFKVSNAEADCSSAMMIAFAVDTHVSVMSSAAEGRFRDFRPSPNPEA